MFPHTEFEENLYQKGLKHIVGIDEVGRGAWAGPVVVGAVIFDPEQIDNLRFNDLKDVKDSKLVPERLREEISDKIKQSSLFYSIAEIQVERINTHGIGKCTQYAYRKAIKLLPQAPEHILIDAFYINYLKKSLQTPIIKGDQKCFSIAAASIIAKVHRDKLMKELHLKFPEYRFDQHKGYGTKYHQEMIKTYGICREHRKSFNLKVIEKNLDLRLVKEIG